MPLQVNNSLKGACFGMGLLKIMQYKALERLNRKIVLLKKCNDFKGKVLYRNRRVT